ncbi:MAG: hypothetical protein AAGC67_10400 [Myxococcota bacterium]
MTAPAGRIGSLGLGAMGELSPRVGGDAVEDGRPALETLGTVLPCGDVGMGQIVKLGNDAMVIGTVALLPEVRERVTGNGMDLDAGRDCAARMPMPAACFEETLLDPAD